MTQRFALLLHAIEVRDWMTFILFLAAGFFLFCGWSITISPLSAHARSVLFNIYAGFCVTVWLGWMIILSLMRFLQ